MSQIKNPFGEQRNLSLPPRGSILFSIGDMDMKLIVIDAELTRLAIEINFPLGKINPSC